MAARAVMIFVLRLIPALTFLVAGILKVIDPPGFAMDIMNYRIVSWPVAIFLAMYLPWVEILIGLGLFIPKVRKGALLLASGMMVVFMSALAAAAIRGLDISCGCFGGDTGTVIPAFLRNCVLLGILCMLILNEKKHA